MKRATRAVAAAAALVVAVAFSANAVAGAAITALAATAGVQSVTVTGKGTFTASEVVLGTDAAGDGLAPGSDIISASIAQDPVGKLTFKMGLTAAAQPVPEVLIHSWVFNVTDAAGTAKPYMLKASRTSYGASQSEAPLFELWSEPDERGVFTVLAPVTGAFTSGSVSWIVDAAGIGASPGATIAPATATSISTSGGVSVGAAGSSAGATVLSFDSAGADEYTVLAPEVQVGLAPAGTPDAEVPLTATAPVKANGSFSAALARPTSGSYVVVAKGCSEDACAVRTTTLTIP